MTLQSLGAEGYTEYRRNGEREYSCWAWDIQGCGLCWRHCHFIYQEKYCLVL